MIEQPSILERPPLMELFDRATERGDYSEIAQIGLDLLRRGEVHPDITCTVALSLVGLSRLAEARATCEDAVRGDRQTAELLRILTVVCFHLNDASAALGYGQQFLSAAGQTPSREAAEVANILGLSLICLHREQEAVELFNRAIEASPGFADPVHNLATVYLKGGDSGRIVDLVRPALAGQPGDTDLLSLFISACEKMGKYTDALIAGERYLEVTEGREGEAERTWVRSRTNEFRSLTSSRARQSHSLRIFYAATREPEIGYDSSYRYFIEPFRALGHEVVTFDCGRSVRPEPGAIRQMNASLYESVVREQKAGGIDLFFSYINDYLIDPGVVRAIRSHGITTINFTWDDVFSDWPVQLRGRRYEKEPIVNDVSGIAGAYDFFWTNCRETIPVYTGLGTRPVCLPGGGNPRLFYPQRLPYSHDVSFVGLNYSYRGQVVEFLKAVGVDIFACGRGFGDGISPFDQMVQLYSASKINLGFTGWGSGVLGRTPKVVKGRDFEIPMSGGFYLVEYFKELEELYEVGREIVCYETIGELVEKIAYYLSRDGERERIRERGYVRARAEHTIDQRLERLLKEIGFR